MPALKDRHRPPLLITRPPVVGALLTTLFNDHIIKHSSLAGLISGKLSDFCGLFFFPFLIFDLMIIFSYLFCRRLPSHHVKNIIFMSCSITTAILFILLKCSQTFLDLYVTLFKLILQMDVAVVQDRSDLFALASIIFSALYYQRTIKNDRINYQPIGHI